MATGTINPIPRGTPPKYNAERHSSIIRDLSQGLTRDCAARRAGITARTLARWVSLGKNGVEPYVSLVSEIKKAEADAEALAIETIRKIGMGEWTEEEVTVTTTTRDGHTTTIKKTKKGKPDWCALAWWAERVRPDDWGKDVEMFRKLKQHLAKLDAMPEPVADAPSTTD